MVVQYLIDWSCLRARINAECGDSARIENIRRDLRSLRKKILVNGILLVDRQNRWTKSLTMVIRELNQDMEKDPIPEWMKLSDELKSYEGLYRDGGNIRLEAADGADIRSALTTERDYVASANLSVYDLPCAVITTEGLSGGGGVECMPLEDYEDSATEKLRESWEDSSFAAGEPLMRIDQYLAGMSLGASVYGSATIYDPYCLCVCLDGGKQTGDVGDWEVAVRKIASFFVRNKHVRSIAFVGKSNLVGCHCRMSWFEGVVKSEMERRNAHRNCSITVRLSSRKENEDWHNRYVDCGRFVCEFPDGLDVFCCDGNQTAIKRNFEVRVLRDNNPIEFNHVKNLAKGVSHKEVCGMVTRGVFSCDRGISDCRPDEPGAFMSIDIHPPIRIALQR